MSRFFERCRFCKKLLIKGQECPQRDRADHQKKGETA